MKQNLIILFLAGALLLGCQKKPDLGRKDEKERKKQYTLRQQIEDMRGVEGAIELPVIRLTSGTITSVLSLTGELVPQKSVVVKPLMEGRIHFLKKIKVGDIVEEGELIAKIDDRDIEDAIEQQKRQIDITRETIKLDEDELARSEKDLAFDRKMLKEGFINEQEFRKSESTFKRAQIALRKSRLQLELEENKLQKELRKREKVPIKAPVSGMVVLASHLSGQNTGGKLLNEEITALEGTQVGTGTQLFGMISRDRFLARCMVNGKDKARISPGQKVDVIVITHREVHIPGQVSSVDHIQDTNTHAYKVWIRLRRSNPYFTSGLFVRANIELDRSVGTIVIPREFLKERDNRWFVQVVENESVRDVWVTTGLEQGQDIEILSGVSFDDLLVASDKVIAAGQKVKPVEIEPEE